ncbi:MAG: hypothetical protein WBD22_00045 [Pyrinomonadaceae bacterium]
MNSLGQLPIGARLLVRSKKDWRTAAVSAVREEKIVLTVCSPTGRTYRLRRVFDTKVVLEGNLLILATEEADGWRENFTGYDTRW